ncbi:MAG: YecR family lipoprotein [Pseudomonadota bacterium]
MNIKIFATGIFIALAGCATVSQMTATGGSRADGVVRLSYELGVFDKARIDESSALRSAQARCKTWGYKDAEAFGGITRQCQAPGGMYGCQRWLITKEYQCLGANAPS